MKKLSAIFVFLFLLNGCTNPLQSHITSLKLAYRLNQDAEISLDKVLESKVDLALIKSGDRPVAIIAKAFAEEGKDKWISEDRAMLVVESGRIIRTQGFKNDLLSLSGIGPDPLLQPEKLNGSSWRSLSDWESGEYGYLSESNFTVESEDITVLEHHFSTIKVTESVEFKAKRNWLIGNQQWDNVYWFDRHSNRLLKAKQRTAPHSNEFLITFVSTAAELLQQGE